MKTSTNDVYKTDLQRRVKGAEGNIQYWKGLANQQESEATGCEKRLGVLKKKGECRP